VGSFSVVLGREMVVCDPGGEVYTKRTFSAHRYDSQVLNSYGHAVPIVAGELQRSGAEAKGVILKSHFTAAADEFQLDIRSAYGVPALEKLVRTFTFARGAEPSLSVSDTVKFSTPETFETALITWGTIQPVGANALEITDGTSRVRVTIDTEGRPYTWAQELINEDVEAKRKPYHLGIKLADKISAGTITLRIEPEAH
jgi:hypothetical protein